MPTKNQALIYTAVGHYLKAIDKAGTDEAVAANAAMRSLPVAFFDHPASLRADGRLLYDPFCTGRRSPPPPRARGTSTRFCAPSRRGRPSCR